MKKGFVFLKTLDFDTSSLLKAKLNELSFVPNMLKLFLSLFQTGDDCLNIDKYMDEDQDLCQLGTLVFETGNEIVYLNKFLSVDEINTEYQNSKEEEEWVSNKLLRIGLVGQVGFGGIYIGCGESNLEEIWLYNGEKETKYVKLASNIFEFIPMLLLEYSTSQAAPCQM